MLESRVVPRRIAVVTVARSDYGHLLPLLKAIDAAPELTLSLFVAGGHLAALFGATADFVAADGWTIAERVDCTAESDAPDAIARSIGAAVSGFAGALTRTRPDVLVVLGDRFEMLGAGLAALPLGVPVAHLHGGEVTEGVIDEQVRHALTKLSHLHFAATPDYARRILQMGEEPWRVHCSGAPGLDRFAAIPPLPRAELARRLGLSLRRPTLLVTFHPVTLDLEATDHHLDELLAALESVDGDVVLTYPGADPDSQRVIDRLTRFVEGRERARLVPALGDDVYVSLLRESDAMVGNSSSGIIEAASFALPVVNIGERQRGRVRAANVIDVGYGRGEIVAGIRRARDPAFRRSLDGLRNPYGDGRATPRIVKTLSEVELGRRLITKRFVDLPPR
jgi:UDP-hydrolysing UDP-N-acetyl-D-glucosamine 2-epimerase